MKIIVFKEELKVENGKLKAEYVVIQDYSSN
jgi:hypothetical protein